MTNTQLRPYAALLVGLASISFGGIFARWADMPSAVAGFYRQAILFSVLAPFVAVRFWRVRHTGPAPTRRAVWLALLAGLFFAADLALWLAALTYTSVANSVLLANTAPVYVALGALLLFGERLSMPFWLGLVLALAGAALIVGQDLRGAAGLGFGDLLALIAGFAYSLFQLTMSQARRGIDALSSAWLMGLSGSLLLLALSLASRQPLVGYSPRQWLALGAMGLVSQTLGWVSINYTLGKLPVSIVSVTLLAQPVATSLLSIPLLHENLSVTQVAGGLVTLVGIYIVNRSRAAPCKRKTEIDPAPASAR